MKNNKQKLVLLDAHAIIHRAYHALPNFATSKGEPTGAVYGLVAMVLKIVKDLKPDYIVACFDLPKPTYRHEFYKDYKAGRAKTDDELVSQFNLSREALHALNIPIYEAEGFEADDLLGTISNKILKNKPSIDVIIASGDMDTMQLVSGDRVRVYTLRKGINDTILYNEKRVIERFNFPPKLIPDFKGLSGDQSDNIIGIPGIGEKTATDLILKFGSIEKIYKSLDKDEQVLIRAGIKPRIIKLLKEHKEEAEFSKILATIRLDVPIKFSLPNQCWRDGISFTQAEKFFSKVEFRGMPTRLKEALNLQGKLLNQDEKVITEKKQTLNHKELTEFGLMVWLLRSSITNPKEEDIFSFVGLKDKIKIKKILESKIKAENLERVYWEIEKPLIPILEQMNKTGVLLDLKKLEILRKEYKKHLETAEKKIWKLAGEKFNIASPKQLSEILFNKLGLGKKGIKKTAGGVLSTKESELQKMKDEHEIVPLILEYREFAKLLSTYIEALPNLVSKDSRIRARFIQTGTATGRLSSVNPNLQNIPNSDLWGKRIREAFISPPKRVLLSFDYSQIELRIGAFLSKDKKMIQAFKNHEDIHRTVASVMFGVSKKEVSKEMRNKAKVINFGVMYGMGIRALKTNLNTDLAEAKKFYDEYFKNFSGLANYLETTKKDARRVGFTKTFFGRKRYFEGLKSPIPMIRASAERMAINAPIQGTEADIIKLAMIKVSDLILKNKWQNKVNLILQVHDELIYEVDADFYENFAMIAKKEMEGILSLKETLGVPILVEVKSGPNWGNLKDV